MDTTKEITSIRVAYASLPPFVDVKNKDGHDVLEGFMPAIVQAVTDWMRLNVTWIREPGDSYGFWNGTSYSGLIGMLARNEVDVIVNPVLPNIYTERIATFSNPIIYEAYTFLSGKENQEGGYFSYFSVLQALVWYAMGITLLVVASTSAILYGRFVIGASFVLSSLQYVWVYIAFMLRQTPNQKWMLRKKTSKVSVLIPFLYMLWLIGIAFLVMNVFQSLLVSKLTIIRQYPVIDSKEEFVSKKSVKGLTPKEIALRLALKDSGMAIYDEMWNKIKDDQVEVEKVFSEDSFNDVVNGKRTIIHGHLILRTILRDYFKKKGWCKFHLSENYFYPFPLLMATKKTLPKKFKDKFNVGITRLVDADLSGKWFKAIFEICYFCTSYSETGLKPLGLKSMYGVLIIWAAGMTLAFVCVVAENIYYNFQEKNKPKRCKRCHKRTDIKRK